MGISGGGPPKKNACQPERGSVSRSNGDNPGPTQITMTTDLIPLNIGAWSFFPLIRLSWFNAFLIRVYSCPFVV
jgi:hypothetical protein